MQLNGKQKPEINYRQMLALCRAQADRQSGRASEEIMQRTRPKPTLGMRCPLPNEVQLCVCWSIHVCVCVRVWVIEQGVATLLLKEMQAEVGRS